jgi:hypothetical protein
MDKIDLDDAVNARIFKRRIMRRFLREEPARCGVGMLPGDEAYDGSHSISSVMRGGVRRL